MRNDDIRAMVMFEADIKYEDYNKILTFFEENNYSTEFPGFIGHASSLAVTGWAVGKIDTSDLVPTKAEEALAKEMGVDPMSLAKLGKYFEEYAEVAKDLVGERNISQADVDAFLNEGMFGTLHNGRESYNDICDNLDIEYSGKLVKPNFGSEWKEIHNDVKYSNLELGVKLVETDTGFEILYASRQDIPFSRWLTTDGNVDSSKTSEFETAYTVVIDDKYKDEFVSEFKERMQYAENKGYISEFNLVMYTKEIEAEIAHENKFLSEIETKVQSFYEREKAEIENKLERIDKILENSNSEKLSEMFGKMKENLEKDLEKVEAKLEVLNNKELEIAADEKEKYTELKDKYQEELDRLDAFCEEHGKFGVLLSKAMEEHRELLLSKIDEANDRINACDNKIAEATTVEEVEVERRGASKIIQDSKEDILAAIEAAKEALDKIMKENIAETKEGVNNAVLLVDNAAGDIKDFAEEVEAKYASGTVVGAVAGAAKVVEDVVESESIKVVGESVAKFGANTAENFAVVGKEAVIMGEEIAVNPSVVGIAAAAGKFYEHTSEDLQHIAKEAVELAKDLYNAKDKIAEEFREFANDVKSFFAGKAEATNELADEKISEISGVEKDVETILENE